MTLMTLSSCSDTTTVPETNTPQFTAAITRATANSWQDGDKVGITMMNDSKAITVNAEYNVSAAGKLAAAHEALTYPQKGTVDFKAYHPYKADITTTYSVDLSRQEDLLYSDNAKAKSNNNHDIQLNFTHQLAQVVVENNTPAATFAIKTMTKADFDLHKGTMGTPSSESTITMADNAAIVIPGTKMTLITKLGDKTAETEINKNIKAGDQLSIPVEIKTDDNGQLTVNVNITGSKITNWTIIKAGDQAIDFDSDNNTEEPTDPEKPEPTDPEEPSEDILPVKGEEILIFNEKFDDGQTNEHGTSNKYDVERFPHFTYKRKLHFSCTEAIGDIEVRRKPKDNLEENHKFHLWIRPNKENILKIDLLGFKVKEYKAINIEFKIRCQDGKRIDDTSSFYFTLNGKKSTGKMPAIPRGETVTRKMQIALDEACKKTKPAVLRLIYDSEPNKGVRIYNLKVTGIK